MRARWFSAAVAAALGGVALLAPLAAAEGEITITGTSVGEGTATVEFAVQNDVVADTDDIASVMTITENGAPIPFQLEPVPSNELEVVLTIDTSGSMRENGAIDSAKQAAIGFVDAMPADVAIGVVGFDDNVSLVAPLTRDRAVVRASIEALQATGETALYDAIVFSESVFSGTSTDRQILLLSDGGDTVSLNTLDDAVAVASEVRTSVIELVSSESNADALRQIAGAGRGTVSSASDPDALGDLYASAASDLLNRYRLTIAPTSTGPTTYVVAIETPDGTFEATTEVDVPAAAVATTTVVPQTTPTTTLQPAPFDPNADVASGSTDSTSDTLRTLGMLAVFVAILLLGVIAFDRSDRKDHLGGARMVAVPAAGSRKDRVVGRATDLADELLVRSRREAGLSTQLEAAGLSLRAGEYAVIVLALGLVGTLLLVALFGPLLGIVFGLVLTPLAGSAFLQNRAGRRREQFMEQLPDTLQLMITSLRSGFGLPQALDSAGGQSPEPMKSELQRVLFEVRIGRDVNEALQAVAERMQSRDFRWVAAAIQINREVGGELARVLENIAETIRGRMRLQRQVQTLTAEGRLSAYILIVLPMGLAAFLIWRDPSYFEPFASPIGVFLVVLAIVLLLVGWLWMRAMIRRLM